MKTLLVFTLLIAVSGLAVAAEPLATPQAAALRPIGECLVSRQVLDWVVIDERRLLVKSLGKRYYDIQLSHRCQDLNRRPYLSFRDGLQPTRLGSGRSPRRGIGADPITADGRICGDIGDAVIPRSSVRTGLELPCDIASIRRIDATTYEAVFKQHGVKVMRSTQDTTAATKGSASL